MDAEGLEEVDTEYISPRVFTERDFIDRLLTLQRHASDLCDAYTLEEISHATHRAIKHVIDFQGGSLSVVESDVLLFNYFWNASETPTKEMALDGPGITVKAAVTGESQNIGNVVDHPEYVEGSGEHSPKVVSERAVPVKFHDKVTGVINVESVTPDAFTELDQRLVEVYARHVVSAMERLNQIDRLREIQEEHTKELIQGADRATSMLRHDLRGPLSTIKNAAFMIEHEIDKTKDMLEIINNSVDYTIDMLEDLKNVTMQSKLTLISIDVNNLVAQAVKNAFIPDEITVDLRLSDGIPSAMMDTVKMKRVLYNLIKNAIDAMPNSGKLRVETMMSENNLVVKVQDTGYGIPDDLMPRLFKPFVTSKVKGMGLGLAFCKQTVEAHGGTISVVSEELKGSTFTVSIPYMPAPKN
ncbi:MAG: GAF domain-containing sensor histidine kinase [Candidatus Bathyarchaeota archaeon]|nr:GAF domain-containing sensor histidine kinase [Candidatus Bathyarchaeota archaeon]